MGFVLILFSLHIEIYSSVTFLTKGFYIPNISKVGHFKDRRLNTFYLSLDLSI